jgi:mono/diheme cytochrome c family protein
MSTPADFARGLRRLARSLRLLAGALACALSCISASSAELSSPSAINGEKLYRSRCAKCHKMYDPAKYSDQQWQIWMEKMGSKARLKPEQKKAVADYVEEKLRHPVKPQEGTEPRN